MACRQYAIKSHGSNSQMESDVIMCKIKENCDYDDKFFDDEEKDWKNIVWFPNKCSIGNFIQEEDKTKFISEIETVRYL